MILNGSSGTGANNAGSGRDIIGPGDSTVWPIDPDPRLTNLQGRQDWHFRDGRAVVAAVAGHRIGADDARIAFLGIRRDARADPFPAEFVHAPSTGDVLGAPVPRPDPTLLDIDCDSTVAVTLPSGRPVLFRAGRPSGLYLFDDNLGTLDVWTGRGFSPLGRLPAGATRSALATGPEGVAYTVADALIVVPLPQLGPPLAYGTARAPGLRFRSAPCWRGTGLLAWAERDGWLVRCRTEAGSDALDLFETGRRASATCVSGPWMNRLGDAVWTGSDGFVACDAEDDAIRFTPWPPGFVPLLDQAPWRDRADMHHQLGMAEDRYHVAALSRDTALRRLDGPHLAAGDVTYWGNERFAVPWQAPAETLNLGGHGASLLVPLLAMPRDTILLAVALDGPRGGFLRGAALTEPATGHVFHHAHGVGLRRLPVSLEVCAIGDAGALLHDGALHLWSRSDRRCHTLRLRPA